MIYQYTIVPLEVLLSILLSLFYGITGSYLLAIILLSIVVRLITTPLEKIANKSVEKEREIKSVISPQIDGIKIEFAGGERHAKIKRLYARYSYHPIYAIRSMFNLLVQLPFFIAAYYMIGESSEIQGIIAPFVGDLSKPDGLLFSAVNLMPFIMTAVNLAAIYTTPGFNLKDSIQGIGIAFLFLILLYSAPVALLIYWTTNNLISLGRNFFVLKSFPKKVMTKSINENSFLQKLKTDGLFIKKDIPYVQIYMLGAFFSFFFALQQTLYLLSLNSWEASNSLWLFVFSVSCFVFSNSAVLTKKMNLKNQSLLLLLLFFIPMSSLVLFVPKLLYSIPKLNTVGLCLIFISLLLVVLNPLKESSFNLKNYFFLSILACFTGFVFHWSNNTDYFSIETAIYGFFIALVSSIVFSLMTFPFLRNSFRITYLDGLGACCILSFLFMPTIHEVLIWKIYLSEYLILFMLFFSIITILSLKIKKAIYVLFGIVILASIGSGVSTIMSASKEKAQSSDSIENRLVLIDKYYNKKIDTPNIYFIVAESTADLVTTEKLGIKTEKMKALLKKYDFKVYDSTCSVGSASLRSVSNTLEISNIAYGTGASRSINGGNSLANKWLQKIGYHTVSAMKNYMAGGYNFYDEFSGSHSKERISFNRKKERIGFNRKSDLTFFKDFLTGLGMREFKFDIGFKGEFDTKDKKYWFQENDYEQYFKDVVRREKEKPTFVIYHGHVPIHSQNSGKCLDDEVDIYQKGFSESVKELKIKLDLIKKHDPESIVVIMGDHGPYLKGDCTTLSGYKPEDVTELLFRERFGTLVAIHWPDKVKAEKYDTKLFLNQDIFPIIFAYIYDSSYPLALKVPAVIRYKGRVFRNGKFLPLGLLTQGASNS